MPQLRAIVMIHANERSLSLRRVLDTLVESQAMGLLRAPSGSLNR